MAQYELITWYPSLPEGIKVGDTVKRFNGRSYHPFDNPNANGIYSKEVENNPKFWKKVVKIRDYEILFIKGKRRILRVKDFSLETGAFLETRPGSGKFNEKKDSIDYIKENFDIYSIKRLSDSKIFTAGDKIFWDWRTANLDYFTIKKFYMKDDGLYFDTVEASAQGFHLDYHLFRNKSILLDRLEHYTVVFTTLDGVDVYEGQKYFYTSLNSEGIYSNYASQNSGQLKEYVYFSTKEKAEKYLEENESRYSEKDIQKALNAGFAGYYGFDAHWALRLKKFWKQLKK